MKKENTLYVIILLAVALAIIIIAAFALTNDTPYQNHNVTKADIVTLDIVDGTIKINIIGEKYKELNSFYVTTNLGNVIIDGKTEIKYNPESPQIIPFSEEMTSIKIIGHFENGTDSEIFSGNIRPGIVAASINPADVKVTLRFESNGGSYISPQTINLNEKTVKPIDPKKSGYVFSGWYSDLDLTKPYAFGNFALTDTTLYAKWLKTHKVVFDSNDGVPKQKTQTVIDGEYAVKSSNPVKVGDNFAGWFSDKSLSTEWNFDESAVTEDITLYAKWAYENGDYSVFGNDCAYKNQYDSVEIFVSSVNVWYLEKCDIDDFLVLKNNKIVSVNGQNPLSLPLLPGREPVMIKSSAIMTLALNSVESFDVSGFSGSQIMIAGEGKIIIDGSLIFVVDRSSYSSGDELIEIEDGGELVLGSEAEVIVRVVNG